MDRLGSWRVNVAHDEGLQSCKFLILLAFMTWFNKSLFILRVEPSLIEDDIQVLRFEQGPFVD